PLASSSALLGLLSWLNCAPATPVIPCCQTICSNGVTSITRALPWSVIRMLPFGKYVFCTGVFSSLKPDPVTPACPYCQTISPLSLISITRLSGQPFGQVGSLPAGAPVPATRLSLPTR